MSSIKDMNIFALKQFVANIECKLSAVTDYYARHQILCVVTEKNELLFHYTNIERCDILKVVTWFQELSKNIVDLCFDPTGMWLLVLCCDHTIHIVPVGKILDKHFEVGNNLFPTDYITSYEVPFVPSASLITTTQNDIPESELCEKKCSPAKEDSLETEPKQKEINEISITVSEPSCITWWNTIDNYNRAVIGYSDGRVQYIGLDPDSSYMISTLIGNESVKKLLIYKDNGDKKIVLLVTLANKEQYRVILEQGNSDHIFSTSSLKKSCQYSQDSKNNETLQEKYNSSSDSSSNLSSINQPIVNQEENDESMSKSSRSSTKSKLASLKMLGSKKMNTLKMKITEQKVNEGQDMTTKDLETTDLNLTAEFLNNKNGFNYVTQNIRNINFLSVLDSDKSILSVHHIDSNLLPLFRYKVPDESTEILITSNILYSIQNLSNNDNNFQNSITILSSALASIKDNNDKFDYLHAVLSSFNFHDESLINIHRKASFFHVAKEKVEINQNSQKNNDEYYFYNNAQKNMEYLYNEDFEKIVFDPCYVVTNKNIYYIDFRKNPLNLIIDASLEGMWKACEQFCNTFNLSFSRCMEFVGDYFLQNKKINQALLSFNIVKIPPVRTALKLAIHRENYPLMHLCAMALKHVHITKSKFFNNALLKNLLKNVQNLHVEDVIKILPKRKFFNEIINEGQHCSDHKYSSEDSVTPLQMSLSSQFHLSNLMLITLAEKAVRDKNYIPLWNFLVSNGKYHSHMTSIVLAQSGLHSSALVLAMARGCLIEVFIALTSVVNQEFGFYSEINVCLYNLSDPIFLECLPYVENVSEQYFNIIQKKLPVIKICVLKRLEKQFSPFNPIFRSIFDKYFCEMSEQNTSIEKNLNFLSFFNTLIETYLAIIIHINTKTEQQSNILNAFSTFHCEYENIKLPQSADKIAPFSVGYTHCSCVIDGVAYFWGWNGVPNIFNIENLQDTNQPFYIVKRLDMLKELNLEVYAVKCGRQHTIILTNNGIFTFGSNQFYQLGIGTNVLVAQHPMLVQNLDGMNITLFDAGQYHNAVIADNKLYTWGWGIYGQLGHGDTENVGMPKVVKYFNDKTVINLSLGHAHSLVLCMSSTYTELYVFGSNHFGQLGIGLSVTEKSSISKQLTPLLLHFEKNITQIQTKFFSNLALTDNNELYVWGSSPQALRLENQNKKRANTKQKIAATITKEIKRRTGETSEQSTSSNSTTDENKTIQSVEQLKTNEESDKLKTNEESDKLKTNEESDKLKTNEDLIPQQKSQHPPLQNNKVTSSEQQPEIQANMDHMSPRLVNTEQISGNILHIATGLFHFATISSDNCLYTWGRNFDHQLGNQDKERKYIFAPTKVDCIDSALYVDCGADFTVVMNKDRAVKTFGGNANGQCGQDIKQSGHNSFNQNLCLPITKRFMRFETHSVVYPHEINLPTPNCNFQHSSSKYFKSLPKYSSSIITKISKEEISLFSLKEYPNTKILNDVDQYIETQDISASCSSENITQDLSQLPLHYSNDYIHYCLLIFHNLYNPEKVMNFAKDNIEYQIRILLLNLEFVDAFRLCLMNSQTPQNATRIFHHFTKNAKFVPIKIENFKIYIYELFNHFLAQNYDMSHCESFFLSDLDYYIVELSTVLYLNSGSAKLANILRRKFEDILKIQKTEMLCDAIDSIFEKLSIRFKTIICRNILKYINA